MKAQLKGNFHNGLRASPRSRTFIARAPCSAGQMESGLSGEALTMFHDAQRNILELNKSRLMALDELKQAKERISELESLCAEYERALGRTPAAQSSYSSSPPAQTSTPSRAGSVTIAYSSGWDEAYIHYQMEDGAWTDLPGVRMRPDTKQQGLFLVTVPVTKMEFVFNNGNNDWDSPYDGKNYNVTEPGEFLVQSGTVSKLS